MSVRGTGEETSVGFVSSPLRLVPLGIDVRRKVTTVTLREGEGTVEGPLSLVLSLGLHPRRLRGEGVLGTVDEGPETLGRLDPRS